jgi:hypothetical protein
MAWHRLGNDTLIHKYMTTHFHGLVFVCEGIVTKRVPSQESEWSCICVLVYRYQACTKPGKWVVVYLCIRVSLPGNDTLIQKYMTTHFHGLAQAW